MDRLDKKYINTIVVGGGQAGLATGYYLKRNGIDFVILDESESPGEVWSRRWDSLTLFTPSQYNGLPGYPFPSKRGTFPNKSEVANYLTQYVKRFTLPVRFGKKVIKVIPDTKYAFEVITNEDSFFCDNLVVATGSNQTPNFPGFKQLISPSVFSIHSSQYKNPSMVPPGDVLVVGAGSSGVQIAIDLAKTHKVFLSGKPTFKIPDFVFKYLGPVYWWFINNFINIKTPLGRKAKKNVLAGGAPLINVSMDDVHAAGVTHLSRVAGVDDSRLKFEDGSLRTFNSLVWATGFKPDFSWINMKQEFENGWPKTTRGVSTDVEGLFFVGMLFQFGLTSAILGGVGRDAKYICNQILERNQGLFTSSPQRKRTF